MKVTMKLNNHILSLLAPALLLCAATLGMTGCTQADDGLQNATGTVARGGEPIRVSIAPKPGFTDGSIPGTRTTVGDDGSFGWVEGTDNIYVRLTFNDAASTWMEHTWHRTSAAATHSYMTGWKVYADWFLNPDKGATEFTGDLVWPLGASKITVRAIYTDCWHTDSDGSVDGGISVQYLKYSPGSTGDHMTFMKDFSLGEEIMVEFSHATTRLVFNGLKPTTAYSLKAGGTALTFPTALWVVDFSLHNTKEQTFTSDADGKLVICAALDAKLDASHKVSLEVMEGGPAGTSAGIVELTAKGSDADGWKMDGNMYTINFVGSGSVNPGSRPDLLAPAPIVAGNKVYAVNGYFVTAPDANESKEYQWSSSPTATVMDSDPCAGHGDWRMPTMKDFETMAGWSEVWPWSQEVSGDDKDIASDAAAWYTAFPDGSYWSSVARTSNFVAYMESYYEGRGSYSWSGKTYSFRVRCVQEQ